MESLEQTSSLRSVTLPDGMEVTVSDLPQDWWTARGVSGYIDPKRLAPDPKNPRRTMSPVRQAELEASIAARGVRQALVITPRSLVPWAQVEPEDEGAFF